MDSHLIENFWNRIRNSSTTIETTWDQETAHLYQLGISMEETLRYLHEEKPNWIDFEKWIQEKEKKIHTKTDSIADVLTKEDLDFWEANGYVVVKNAISEEDCLSTQKAIWQFLEKDPDDSTTWYKTHTEQKGLMVNFFNHPTLEKNRASLKIQKAYEQLYGTDRIYKTIDKVSFNPPITTNYSFLGSNLHWDVSLKQPIPYRLQGLLYLSDCSEKEGAFHCVPGFHHHIANWMESLATTDNPREVALKELVPKPVIGKAGDFVIWHQALPHCATPNYGKKPRLVQYLTYFPEEYVETSEWI